MNNGLRVTELGVVSGGYMVNYVGETTMMKPMLFPNRCYPYLSLVAETKILKVLNYFTAIVVSVPTGKQVEECHLKPRLIKGDKGGREGADVRLDHRCQKLVLTEDSLLSSIT